MAVLLARATMVFEEAAAANVMVQVVVPEAEKVEGEQVSPDSPVGATRLICAVRMSPLRVAETVTVWPEAIAPAVTVKIALVAPLATDTVAGVVRDALSSFSVTVVVPDEALSRDTVQAAL